MRDTDRPSEPDPFAKGYLTASEFAAFIAERTGTEPKPSPDLLAYRQPHTTAGLILSEKLGPNDIWLGEILAVEDEAEAALLARPVEPDKGPPPVSYDEHERQCLELIDQRDRAEEMADRLAGALAPPDILGEHSNLNDPWQNALEWAGAGRLLARRAPGDRDALLEAVAAIPFYPDATDGPVDVPPGTSRRLRSYRSAVLDALRADSRPEQPAPLDVERLARALDMPSIFEDTMGPEALYELAVEVAREYDLLADSKDLRVAAMSDPAVRPEQPAPLAMRFFLTVEQIEAAKAELGHAGNRAEAYAFGCMDAVIHVLQGGTLDATVPVRPEEPPE